MPSRRWPGSSRPAARSIPSRVVGLALAIDHQLFNCAAVVHRGRILGVVPKTYLPNYREFYEMRQFVPGDVAVRDEIELCGQSAIPVRRRLLFAVEEQPLLTFHVEICEDLWVPIPPSSYAALAGATVLLNPSGSPVTVAKAEYRRALVANQSARCLAAYLYAGAGAGESTTDLAWDGQALICENGNLLAESQPLQPRAATRLLGDRPRAPLAGTDAPDQLRADRAPSSRRAAATFARSDSRPNSRGAAGCCPSAGPSASPTCLRIRRSATSDARRFTKSRCRGWRRGCARPESSAS